MDIMIQEITNVKYVAKIAIILLIILVQILLILALNVWDAPTHILANKEIVFYVQQ
jgi:hypothetical protein